MFDSKQTAVIFIEFQNDFCKTGGKLYNLVASEIERNHTIENAVRLLKGAREKGIFVIHCPFVLDRSWTLDCHFEGILKNVVDNDVFVPRSWGGSIIDELAPVEGEIILSGKRALNGFVHTDLGTILETHQIKNVGVAGFLTNVCAQATAWGAYDLGYRTRLIIDACGAASEQIQKYVEQEVCPLLGGSSTVDAFLQEIE